MRPELEVDERDLSTGENWSVQTNRLGLRDVEISPSKASRVLMLGDSVTMGFHLGNSDSVPRQLQEQLYASGLTTQVVNAGISANNIRGYLSLYREIVEQIHPRLVLVGLVLNDVTSCCALEIRRPPRILERSVFFQRAFESYSIASGGEKIFSQLDIPSTEIKRWQEILSLLPAAQAGSMNKDFHDFLVQNSWNFGLAWVEDAWRARKSDFLALREEASRRNQELLFVVFPIRYQVNSPAADDAPQRFLEKLASEVEVPIIDLLPFLKAEAGGGQLFRDDVHLTPLGARAASRAIKDQILASPALSKALTAPLP